VQVWTIKAISPWSTAQSFTISCGSSVFAQVTSLWQVANAQCGHTSNLWAHVKNTGIIALPANAKIWYWVDGPSWSGNHWVGSSPVAGLAVNANKWVSYAWAISASATAGSYTYWAQAWSTKAISGWKGPQRFSLSCP
jgi:hypothetical protein